MMNSNGKVDYFDNNYLYFFITMKMIYWKPRWLEGPIQFKVNKLSLIFKFSIQSFQVQINYFISYFYLPMNAIADSKSQELDLAFTFDSLN